MASGLFALLDDIASLMDDVATATKVASQKTAGILGDDLAVNAEKSTGFVSSRELPVLWAITKGSFLNKVIIIPAAFLLNVYLPLAITIILMVGGAYLAYEGVEKIFEYFFHRHGEKAAPAAAHADGQDHEQQKVRDAVRTDFILSIEIIIIALSTVLHQELWLRIATVCLVGLIATVGVYGVVALIVRMDDVGLKLIARTGGKGFMGALGRGLVQALPLIIKALGIIGTVALLLVAGGLFLHNIPWLHRAAAGIPEVLASAAIGLVVGTATLLLVMGGKRIASVFGKGAKA